jgi:hypothetical protein
MSFVSHLRQKMKDEHPRLKAFVDEWSLQPGDTPRDAMEHACATAKVGEDHSVVALDS